jgi:hypothetical protein
MQLFRFTVPDRKVDIKDNQLGIKLIPMISTWDQVDPIFPVRFSQKSKSKQKQKNMSIFASV